MKLKSIAATALLAAAAPAFAAIAPPSNGNSELIFVIHDDTEGTKISYTLDLGITMDAFLTAGQQEAGYHQEWNLSGSDANFASFLSQTNASSYEWAVVGGDSTGGVAAGGVRWFTTAAPNVTLNTVKTMTNTQLSNAVNNGLLSYFVAVNQTGTHPTKNPDGSFDTAANGSSVNTLNDSGVTYFGESGGVTGNMSGNSPFSIVNAVGASSSLYSLARSGSAGGSAVTVDPFDNATGLGVFSFIQTGDGYQLSYTLAGPVAEVPEPGGLAMLLAGFTAMGFVGRRRSSR